MSHQSKHRNRRARSAARGALLGCVAGCFVALVFGVLLGISALPSKPLPTPRDLSRLMIAVTLATASIPGGAIVGLVYEVTRNVVLRFAAGVIAAFLFMLAVETVRLGAPTQWPSGTVEQSALLALLFGLAIHSGIKAARNNEPI